MHPHFRRFALFALCAWLPAVESSAGVVSAIATAGNDTVVTCDGARVRLSLCRPDIVRVSVARTGEDFPADEPILVQRYDWPAVQATVDDQADRCRISTSALVVEIAKQPLRVTFSTPAGRILTRTAADGIGFDGARRVCRMDLDAAGSTEHFFGLGMQFWRGDLRGTTRTVRMAAVFGARPEQDGESHYVNPFVLSTAGYGLYLHSSSVSRFDLGKGSPTTWSFETPLGGLDYYLLAGPGFTPLVEGFAALCGRMAMPPRYALGLSYRGIEKGATGEKLLETAKAYRTAGIPLDIIGTEPTWQTKRHSHRWNPEFTPDPGAWIKALGDLHLRVNLWERSEYMPSMTDFPNLAKLSLDTLPDHTLPEVQAAWFAGSRRCGFDLGAQGFKADENDHWRARPGTTMPGGMPAELYENLHAMLVQRTYTEQCRSAFNRRYFGWSRGGFTGSQRYPVAGYSDAFDFKEFVRATVSSAFWGAYFCPEYRATGDRQAARLQMMLLGPFAVDNQYITGTTPISSTGKPNATYLAYATLRYRLIPYLYSGFWQQHRSGLPLIRHTMMEFPDDAQAWRQDLQYFLGRDLLLAPLYANPRPVYLPSGVWTDFFTGRRIAGGRTIDYTSANGEMPIFIRSGAAIPMQPDMAYVDEKPVDVLTILATAGDAPPATLYEDDGLTWDYQQGAFSETAITVSMPDRRTAQVQVGATSGSYRTTPRTILVQGLFGLEPAAVTVNGTPLARLDGAGGTAPGWWYENQRGGTTWVRFPATPGGAVVRVTGKTDLDDTAAWRSAWSEVSARATAAKIPLPTPGTDLPTAIASLDAQVAEAAAKADGKVLATLEVAASTSVSTAPLSDPRKRTLEVAHVTGKQPMDARGVLRFDLATVTGTVTKATIALTCVDAGKPLPGHDGIHAMLYATTQAVETATLTWDQARALALEPVVDFFPQTGPAQQLDVTAAVQRALSTHAPAITFVLDSIDDMTPGKPLRFIPGMVSDNKDARPLLILEGGG